MTRRRRRAIRCDRTGRRCARSCGGRDLEQLLNSRRRFLPWPAELKEPGSRQWVTACRTSRGGTWRRSRAEEFRRSVEQVIRTYEPRFQAVHVEMLSNSEQIDRTLRFRVDAILRAEPVPIEVIFDSQLEPSTGSFDVKGRLQ